MSVRKFNFIIDFSIGHFSKKGYIKKEYIICVLGVCNQRVVVIPGVISHRHHPLRLDTFFDGYQPVMKILYGIALSPDICSPDPYFIVMI